ncbi:30S ribosomal protein S8 [bacterium]|jgi:small subunit ribosomal protein S8|nr:30S ribosomal protein S8 [bacterium]
MTMTDTVADMLTRIRNGNLVSKPEILVPYSVFKEEILKVMKENSFIKNYEVLTEGPKRLKVELIYHSENSKGITEIKKVSKPSSRVYVTKDEIPVIKKGKGIAILSTSKGILSDEKARELGVGGEFLFYVW